MKELEGEGAGSVPEVKKASSDEDGVLVDVQTPGGSTKKKKGKK